MANSLVQLVPFGELPAPELGTRLHEIMYGGRRAGSPDPWIAADFPRMVGNYVTPAKAVRRVEYLAEVAAKSRGSCGTLAVVYQDVVIGAVSFAQEELTRTIGWWPLRTTVTLSIGPMLACWLARPQNRPGPRLYLLPHIIQATAELLATNGTLHGLPWTLVRPDRADHGYVGNCLTDSSNGFRGFCVQERGKFPEVDGVRGVRKLFVGNSPIEALLV